MRTKLSPIQKYDIIWIYESGNHSVFHDSRRSPQTGWPPETGWTSGTVAHHTRQGVGSQRVKESLFIQFYAYWEGRFEDWVEVPGAAVTSPRWTGASPRCTVPGAAYRVLFVGAVLRPPSPRGRALPSAAFQLLTAVDLKLLPSAALKPSHPRTCGCAMRAPWIDALHRWRPPPSPIVPSPQRQKRTAKRGSEEGGKKRSLTYWNNHERADRWRNAGAAWWADGRRCLAADGW